MVGKLIFFYMPVDDIAQAKKFYRDTLGLNESWREGDLTVAFKLPESDLELMVDETTDSNGPGPIFLVPSVRHIYSTMNEEIKFSGEPGETPDGLWLSGIDHSGNAIYFTDESGTK
ncbi:VOC family protein [Evansella halocellulosilytica]|uniref:VOC family protein n=1 Tax=Evansella halocellulosilytica TaxID=2011013 RepID=UPI000BB8332B|nr:VOC family protein [Evansella halocellulosilytica]